VSLGNRIGKALGNIEKAPKKDITGVKNINVFICEN
jgi:hypothetical protein